MIDNEDWLKYRSWDLYFGKKPVSDLATLLKVLDNPSDPVKAVMKFVALPVWNSAPDSLVHEVAEWLESKGLIPKQTTKAFFHGNQHVTAEQHLAEADKQEADSKRLADEASQLEREGKNSLAVVRGFQSVVAGNAARNHRRMASEIRKGGEGSGVRGHTTADTTPPRQVDAGRNQVSPDREQQEHAAEMNRHLQQEQEETEKGNKVGAERHKIAAVWHFLHLMKNEQLEKGGAGSGRYPKGSILAHAGLPTEGWSITEENKYNAGGKYRGDKPRNTSVFHITTPNNNTIIVPKRNGEQQWNLGKPETAEVIKFFESVAKDRTLDLATTMGENGDAGGWVHPASPQLISIAPLGLFRKFANEPEYASRAQKNPLIVGKLETSTSLGNSPTEMAQIVITHELGHSKFYLENHRIQEIFKPINDTLVENNQLPVDFDKEISAGLDEQIASFRSRGVSGLYMPGQPQDHIKISDYKDFALKAGDGSSPLRTGIRLRLRELGVTNYGSSSLQETVAELHAIFHRDEIPATPLLLRIADTLGWGRKQEASVSKSLTFPAITVYDDFIGGVPMVKTDIGVIPFI